MSGAALNPRRPPGNFGSRKPAEEIDVPREYRRTTYQREADRLTHTWKVEYGCDVALWWEQWRITKFAVYGTGAGLEKTIGEIHKWILKAKDKAKESSAWAKMPAYDVNEWWFEQVRSKEAARKEVFKGPVPEDDDLRYATEVPWPEELRTDDPPILPKDAFGPKLDKLDPLRVEHEVYITQLTGPNWPVEIRGYTEENVDAAVQHYNSMVLKIRIQIFGSSRPVSMALDEIEGIDVHLQEAPRWWPNRDNRIVPRLIHSPMMNERGDFRTENLHFTHVSVIQHALKLGLEAIRREKGYYDLSIHFGALVLKNSTSMPYSQIGKKYHKDHFMAGINGPIRCETKKWLIHNEDGQALLSRLTTEDEFLEPIKAAGFYGHAPTSLTEIRPVFRGTWIFQAQPACMVVQIDWSEDEDGLYEKGEIRYFRLKPDKSGPVEHLDMKLLELGEGRAWQFNLISMTPILKKLASPALIGFAEGVKLKRDYRLDSNEPFWQQKKAANLTHKYYRLEKIYSFGIRRTSYKIELVGIWYPGHKIPCWGLNIRHSEWATHLAELERLVLGRGANWGDAISTFLPDDGISAPPPEDEEDHVPRLGDLNLRSLGLTVEAPPRDGIRLLLDKMMQLSIIISELPDTSRTAVVQNPAAPT